MRVAGVRVETLEIPFVVPFASGAARWERRRMALVTLHADPGIEGRGELTLPVDAGPAALRGLDRLEGIELTDQAAVDAMLESIDALPLVGRGARSAVASAVVDAMAQAQGRPVASSLASTTRSEVAVNALIGRVAPDDAASQAHRLAGEGYGCLKVKGGHEPAADLVDRVAAVRMAVGPKMAIRLDLNGTLDASDAEDVLRRLAPFDLEYVEQPMAATAGMPALARVRRGSGIPIAADEAVGDLSAARALLKAGAVDALVVKPSRVGGLREARRIVDVAADTGVPVTVSTFLESGVGIATALHLAATVPGDHAHGLATAHLLASDLLASSLPITRGRMAVPTGAGLGVRLDASAVRRYRVA